MKKFKREAPVNNVLDINQALISLDDIDYKNIPLLKKFINGRKKILSKAATGLSSAKQRKLRFEIKKARIMALLPFTDRHSLS